MKRSQILRIVLGGQLLISTLKLFGEGGGEGGGDPYTNQHPTLVKLDPFDQIGMNINNIWNHLGYPLVN